MAMLGFNFDLKELVNLIKSPRLNKRGYGIVDAACFKHEILAEGKKNINIFIARLLYIKTTLVFILFEQSLFGVLWQKKFKIKMLKSSNAQFIIFSFKWIEI